MPSLSMNDIAGDEITAHRNLLLRRLDGLQPEATLRQLQPTGQKFRGLRNTRSRQ